MKANELRIGNLILDNKEVKKVTSGMLSNWDIIKRDYGGYNPIPITEEWLLKLGFESNLDYEWYLESSYDWITLENIDKYFFQVKFGDNPLRKVKHVHQLQNLYFALTGEELTLNEKQDA